MLRQMLGWMLLAPLLAAAVPAFGGTPASSGTAAATVAWRGWNDGLAAAAGGSKPVIVDVYTDWCGWCKRMDRDVYSRAEVSDYLNQHFVMVRLNAESAEHVSYAGHTMTARALAGGFQVTGYPTMIFLKPDGTHMVNVPGYVPADKFMKLVRFIGDGHMDKGESWEEYSRASGAGPK
jgi:thioredoxin-related protein